jgi:hypothetical protein
VGDLEALQYANLMCNEQGMDPISFGATVGAVMELYELGILTDEEQIGIAAPFGSAEALATWSEITASGRGLRQGDRPGQRSACATKYGYPELSMSVKGQEFPAYDARGIQGMGLTYATSNRGACHLRSYTVASEVLGIPVKTDPLVTEGKPELVKAFQDATAVFDSAGICVFTSFAWTWPTCSRRSKPPARATGRWKSSTPWASASGTWSALQQRGGPHPQGRRPAAAPQDRSSPDRTRQGARQRHRQDAARVLHPPRLDPGRGADPRDPGTPGALSADPERRRRLPRKGAAGASGHLLNTFDAASYRAGVARA